MNLKKILEWLKLLPLIAVAYFIFNLYNKVSDIDKKLDRDEFIQIRFVDSLREEITKNKLQIINNELDLTGGGNTAEKTKRSK